MGMRLPIRCFKVPEAHFESQPLSPVGKPDEYSLDGFEEGHRLVCDPLHQYQWVDNSV